MEITDSEALKDVLFLLNSTHTNAKQFYNMMVSNKTAINTSDSDEDLMNNMYNALFQCFGIIITGYMSGRLGLVSHAAGIGLNRFVGTFALPSLIFVNMAVLELSSVNLVFLGSLLLSKTLVFVSVALITVLVTRPPDIARAALFAIFCTQSNDFAIGAPIFEALYRHQHSEFVQYLYLVAPINLIILNPFGFAMMELGQEYNRHETTRRSALMGRISRNIICNPVVFMTALGMIANLVFNHDPPKIITTFLGTFGNAFTATALFLLGLRMVGNISKLRGEALILPLLLIAAKLLVLPLVIRELTSIFLGKFGTVNADDSLAFSMFGFLYGMIPSAPAVFVYASAYNLEMDLIASSMVLCVFFSAPIMFLTAKIISVAKLDPSNNITALKGYQFNVSILAIPASLWIILVMLKKLKSLPFKVVFCLVISQVISCTGVLLEYLSETPQSHPLTYVQLMLSIAGDMSCYIWTACLAYTLLIMHKPFTDEFQNKIIYFYMIISWGVPILLVSVLMLTCQPPLFIKSDFDQNYVYGTPEAATLTTILLSSIICTVVCLVLHQRLKHKIIRPIVYSETINDVQSTSKQSMDTHCIDTDDLKQGLLYDTETNVMDNNEYIKHFLLLIMQAVAMFVTFSVAIWRIFGETNGLYLELAYSETSLMRGQSIFTLLIYGINYQSINMPIVRTWNKFWWGGSPIECPSWEELPYDTRKTCDNFMFKHREKCLAEITHLTRWKLWKYKKTFTGSELVTWLVENNICSSRDDALGYSIKLWNGQVLRHLNCTEHFQDVSNILYTFNRR
ncbi:lysosomal cholesterol signaling protein [Metopolophium dirhodum]|uniref:lysosomal cholesterol signaling protein n=1 Tax=Metopolophium dirhodum TaxID=44670 RepID=UPI0029902A2C|nr:lysosomal cholesterol signaling protein [Metopolophium dirhodum]XP_060864972.1 lysosomal cholesterol signaling protein [Metopolophium dirhodum]